MLVDNAVYVDGRRTADPTSLEETFETVRDRNGFAWIGLYRPIREGARGGRDRVRPAARSPSRTP